MSNKENPSSGYVMEAVTLAKLLPAKQADQYLEMLKQEQFEEAIALLSDNVPGSFPVPEQIFILDSTDTPDDELEQDVPYAFFDEGDLYERREKQALGVIRDTLQEIPTFHTWSIWS